MAVPPKVPRCEVLPFRAQAVPAELSAIAPAMVLERWCAVDRTSQDPRLVAVLDDACPGWAGAALLTARPGTAYLKIVDAVGDLPAVLAAVLDLARSQGVVQLKWEGWTVTPEAAAEAGFASLKAPDTGSSGLSTGYVRWLQDVIVEAPVHRRQSEHFTCAAVCALSARVHAGAMAQAQADRAVELTLWRRATNFAACEPVGLGVAVGSTWPDAAVTICLDTERPVLLESYPEPEQRWRAVLQRASRDEAAAAGIPIQRRRMEIPELRDALAAGEHVLLVLSLAQMLGYEVPHWVLCHAAVPGAVVIEDPWVDEPRGETWVDAHLLPVPDASLSTMSSLGEDGYRGAVRIGRSR